jgi:hypothetical protein
MAPRDAPEGDMIHNASKLAKKNGASFEGSAVLLLP